MAQEGRQGPKISIVVPVYNAVEYLDACVESIQAQTVADWELFLIDDGSTDGSAARCDYWAEKEPRARAFHQKNGGPQAAVNRGVQAAQGQYIAFVDSDDWVEPNYLAVLCESMEQTGADVVQCSYWRDDGGQRRQVPMQGASYTKQALWETVLPALYREDLSLIMPSRCIKLWKTAQVKAAVAEIPPEQISGEDYLMTLAVLFRCGGVHVLHETPLYHYRQRTESITHRYKTTYRIQNALFWNTAEQLAQKYGFPFREKSVRLDQGYVSAMVKCGISDWPMQEKRRELKLLRELIADPEQIRYESGKRPPVTRLFLQLLYHRQYQAAAGLSLIWRVYGR